MDICVKCRHCKVVSFPDIPASEIYCKRYIDSVDYITGEIRYKKCRSVRQDNAVCTHWEQGGIKGFFKRHF